MTKFVVQLKQCLECNLQLQIYVFGSIKCKIKGVKHYKNLRNRQMGKNKDSRKIVMMVLRAKNNEQILNNFKDDKK